VGNTGTAHPGLLLAVVLDRAQPGQTIVVLTLADGATATVFRTTDALPGRRSRNPVAAQIAAGRHGLPYTTYLTWRGLLDREPPRRPEPDHPYAAPAYRRREWKFGYVASKCTACDTRHLPPGRVCLHCHAVDEMVAEPMADVPGALATFTVDRLAYSLNPPLLFVAVDYDGGGRFRCELTDAAPDEAAIGLRVEMTFRKLVTAGGIHNYFWKARPVRANLPSGVAGGI
jgi:hydroxymethylglutaryl-CoA synthase